MIYHLFELEPVTSIKASVELADFITEDSDLINIDHTMVEGKIAYDSDTVIFDVEVKTTLTQKCAITLLPVTYDLSFHAEIVFSNDIEIYDYVLEDPIDFRPILYAYIVTEKPYTVFHPSADREAFEKKQESHPAFEGLKDILKK